MATDAFFRAWLGTMSDLRHALAVLGIRMPWADLEAPMEPLLAHKNRAGEVNEYADLFGST